MWTDRYEGEAEGEGGVVARQEEQVSSVAVRCGAVQCRAVQCSAVQVRQCQTEAGERSDRLDLFTLDREDEGREGVALLLAENSLLEGTGRQLQDGRRLLVKTETVRAVVLGAWWWRWGPDPSN